MMPLLLVQLMWSQSMKQKWTNKQLRSFICFIHQKEEKKVKLDIFFHQFNMFLEASLNFVEVKSILKKKIHCPE